MPSEAPKTFRTFICVEIPASLRKNIASLQDDLRAVGSQVSWTKADNIHLTLKFLGDVAEPDLPKICRASELAATGIEPFALTVAGTGCFPSAKNPRVLWVGFQVLPEPLTKLQSRLEEFLDRVGFPRENQRFRPHLTIGRVRSNSSPFALSKKLEEHGFESQTFAVDRLVVMRSQLNPKGSIYTPLQIIPLKS
jgi:RNA 2',3'-cyclic 3'-phosphodiesterase